jgi:hypothetical protein
MSNDLGPTVIEVATEKRIVSKVLRLDLESGLEHPVQKSPEKKFRPKWMHAEWIAVDNGQFALSLLRISGPIILKGGRVSQTMWGEDCFWRYGIVDPTQINSLPKWILELISTYRPED